MAVEAWELAEDRLGVPRPRLGLVPTPPRRGHPVAAVMFVALLVGILGLPVIQAAPEAPVRPTAGLAPVPPASQVGSLDPLSPVPAAARPASRRPAGGIAFVSCTNLWTALPDGSHARKLLAFAGAMSPAFSPDGKTIAFVGPRDRGMALFMVAGDGSRLTEIGPFTHDGAPIEARVTNLTWSETGRKLAFALVDPARDPLAGGSTIWTFDLETGTFERIGNGLPSPGFLNGRLVYSHGTSSSREGEVSFDGRGGNGSAARRLSSAGDDLAFAAVPTMFSDSWAARHGAVLLSRDGSGETRLVVKRVAWGRGAQASHRAPSPFRFHSHARMSMSQDGSRATVDLVDPKGDRAVGVIELDSGDWTVLDHAWSPAFTPAPSSTGPVGAQRAARLADDILRSWGRKGEYNPAALLVGYADDDIITGKRRGHFSGAPEKIHDGWRVPTTVYARSDGTYRFQRVSLDILRRGNGVLGAKLHSASRPHPLRTIDDAKAFVAAVVGDAVAFRWPASIPPGTKLNQRWPVDAYSWDGDGVATVHLLVPDPDRKWQRSLHISYGDVSFSLGCGGENNPEEGEVGEEPALYDAIDGGRMATRQVLWPATLKARDTAIYSVYGEMPRAELERIARSMSP